MRLSVPSVLRKRVHFRLAIACLLSLSGCGGSDNSTPVAELPPTTSETEFAGAPPAEVPATSGDSVTPRQTNEIRPLQLEKDQLKFGFIKLTDCAPIVIAKEKGFFEDEGLQVEVIAQPNWKQLLDNVITGELDGAHMLSGQPIAATIGFGTKARIITAYTLDLNGNGITVSNAVWDQMVASDPTLGTPGAVFNLSIPVVSKSDLAGVLNLMF